MNVIYVLLFASLSHSNTENSFELIYRDVSKWASFPKLTKEAFNFSEKLLMFFLLYCS